MNRFELVRATTTAQAPAAVNDGLGSWSGMPRSTT